MCSSDLPLSELHAEAGKASEAALAMLRALAWGPPVGTLSVGGRAPGAAELVRRGWLVRDHDTAGRTRFVMPRQVALALRGGRLSREPLRAPEPDDLIGIYKVSATPEHSMHTFYRRKVRNIISRYVHIFTITEC